MFIFIGPIWKIIHNIVFYSNQCFWTNKLIIMCQFNSYGDFYFYNRIWCDRNVYTYYCNDKWKLLRIEKIAINYGYVNGLGVRRSICSVCSLSSKWLDTCLFLFCPFTIYFQLLFNTLVYIWKPKILCLKTAIWWGNFIKHIYRL